MELSNGDHKTLVKREFARVAPAEVPDLWLPNRTNFPSTFRDTLCATVRGDGFLQAQKPGRVSHCRGILFRCFDCRGIFRAYLF